MPKVDGNPNFELIPEHWKQFTLYPPGCLNKFPPLQVLHTFLPMWLEENKNIKVWHVLFEPSALVRFISSDMEKTLESAQSLAKECGLEMTLGDASDVCPGQHQTVDYLGETNIYGPALWEANKNFMQASSALSLELTKLELVENVWALRKFNHLLLNAMGMNFLEEAAFHQHCAMKSLDGYLQYGRG